MVNPFKHKHTNLTYDKELFGYSGKRNVNISYSE